MHGRRNRPTVLRNDEEDEMATSAERFGTVIVGGGQAGLATGYHLAKETEW